MLHVNTVVLLLGSNLGQPMVQLEKAIHGIQQTIGEVFMKSRIYRSSAWGKTNQPDFLNQALCVRTILNPEEVLDQIRALEHAAGRKREVKWGPRIIDIDILYYNEMILQSEQLSIPHPEIPNRRFTLLPLEEIIPDYLHPAYLKTPTELLQHCTDEGEVVVL